ncbi:nucleotidyltransferase domain-containing protein [Paenibacillus mendelii]|uniref:Nucleotidyltransferase domain-containing protein n=1 Tax=Paenibacillus mendelii TaxID=206163 RepID=A0ABV6J724_9BACL|nr:nucleotidyltransferase domain-containing protein [Paenibacillus mendelii]MCQ6560987.1 nucleotidyltransferase domain-containing protein [Paenibacillus mendelii]
MQNVLDVAHTLVRYIQNNYPDDVAVIAYYGSRAQGTATKRSDLDFFFIPATSNGYQASIQFVIDDISFDFWPISWERAGRMAAFEEPSTSIIAECKLLYTRSEDDRDRFLKLRETIGEMPRHGLKFMEKAESKLQEAYVHLYKMSRSGDTENITLYRNEAQGLLTSVLYSLALLNKTYFTKGWGKNTEQIMNFPLQPTHLKQLMDTIMNAHVCLDIRAACEQLVQDTLQVLIEHKDTYAEGPSYSDRMKGFYEEVKGIFDKLLTACEMNDYNSAFIWAIGVQDEIARFLYYAAKGHWPVALDPSLDYQRYYVQAGFPNLVTLLDPDDLMPLRSAVARLNEDLESHLRAHGVDICRFDSLAQFEAFLQNR